MKILRTKEFWIAWGIATLLIILLYIIFKPNNDKINREIKRLKQENKMLKKNNDSIYLVIKSIEELENQSDIKISILEADAVRQSKEVSDLNIKIKSIKNKYEKANNHTANFTSIDIQRYFSDSLN
jgi:uncharacterized membrane protein YhiD involved in acid resistance